MEDAAVSLPRSVRHNDSITWVVDQTTSDSIWDRCTSPTNSQNEIFSGKLALGLNNRFRFYRYQRDDYFSPHTDGAWPGSAVVNRELVANAFNDRFSQLTCLLFLSDGYEGGCTQFYLPDPGSTINHAGQAHNIVNVTTPVGGALCFPHGSHPLHCLHSSELITSGIKYIIRTDVLFEL